MNTEQGRTFEEIDPATSIEDLLRDVRYAGGALDVSIRGRRYMITYQGEIPPDEWKTA